VDFNLEADDIMDPDPDVKPDDDFNDYDDPFDNN
jgi:hypothetical protein